MRSVLIQVAIFFAIFQFLTFVKQTNMLSTDENMSATSFELQTTTGEVIALSPKKQTILYFFAPWCSICHASIENLQSVYEKNPNIDVIAVGLDYVSPQEIVDFTNRHQLTFPIAFGNEKVKQAYKISGYPSYYLMSEQNTVISKSMGYSTEIGLYLRSL